MTPGLADEPAGPDRAEDQPAAAGAEVPGGESGLPVEAVEEVTVSTDAGADAGSEAHGQEGAAEPDPLAEAIRERDEYLDLAQRTKAEFDNYRKRVASEAEQATIRGRTEVAEGVIEALDNLERAMVAEGVEPAAALADGLPDGASVTLQGLLVAYRDLVAALSRAGIEQFDPAGEAFDPNLHEALQAIEADGPESGTVLEVMQRGYRAGDQVIRAARVVVSK